MKKTKLDRKIDKMDYEIMMWMYDCIKINFGVVLVQSSTGLRDILRQNLKNIIK